MSRAHIHIGVGIDGAGHDPGAWRQPGARPERLFTAQHAVDLALIAERGGLDYVSLDDSFALQGGGEGVVRGQLDALLTLARVAPATQHVGLVAAVTTTHTEPFHVSKNLATLDLVSGGHAGWLVQVSSGEAEARHFGRKRIAGTADLYAEAGEAIDVVGRLWDSWEDGAVIRDTPTGRYIDRTKLHYVDFEGRFFSVRGPSITPRSPQGQPLVVVHTSNGHAAAVAAAWADVVLVDAATAEDAAVARSRVIEAALAIGRDTASITVLAVVDLVPDATAAALADTFERWVDVAGIDGFHVRPATLPRTLQWLVDEVVPLLVGRGLFRSGYTEATFRERFGLDRPINRYAAVGAPQAGRS